jgi:hypothetical protein
LHAGVSLVIFATGCAETGGTEMTKRPRFEILTSATFWGFTDQWTEYLCIERGRDGGVTLTSRSRQILAEVGQYIDEEGEKKLPSKIGGQKVWGSDGDFVVGEKLVPVW